MKKQKALPPLSRSTADQTAKNLVLLGQQENDKKLPQRIAMTYAKGLASFGVGDFNDKFFSVKEIQKAKNFWTQVHNILAKR